MSNKSLTQPSILPSLDNQTSIMLQHYDLLFQLCETIEEITIFWDILAQEKEN